MTFRIHSLTFDCAAPVELARFWATALDYEIRRLEDEVAWIEDPRAQCARLLFLKVPEGKTAKNRVHLDLEAGDMEAEVDRLIALGGKQVPALRLWRW